MLELFSLEISGNVSQLLGLHPFKGRCQRVNRGSGRDKGRSRHGSKCKRRVAILGCLRRRILNTVNTIVSFSAAADLRGLPRVVFVVGVKSLDLTLDIDRHLVVMDANFVTFMVPLAAKNDC